MHATPPTNPLAAFSQSGVASIDESDLRRMIGAFYESHRDLRSSGMTEPDYEATILPTDRPAWRHAYADTTWSCAIRLRAAMFHMGVKHPLVTCPYETRVGHAVQDVATVARAYDALREYAALADYEPQAGDALCSMGPAGPHVSCVVSATWEVGARLLLECVDGGQGHKGSMAIERNAYLYDKMQAGPALRSVEAPGPGRPVHLDKPGPPRGLIWVIDLWALALNAGLLK